MPDRRSEGQEGTRGGMMVADRTKIWSRAGKDQDSTFVRVNAFPRGSCLGRGSRNEETKTLADVRVAGQGWLRKNLVCSKERDR